MASERIDENAWIKAKATEEDGAMVNAGSLVLPCEPMETGRLESLPALFKKAKQVVFDVSKRGDKAWRMSIPVNREIDSDCILIDAIQAGEKLLAELDRVTDELKDAQALRRQYKTDHDLAFNELSRVRSVHDEMVVALNKMTTERDEMAAALCEISKELSCDHLDRDCSISERAALNACIELGQRLIDAEKEMKTDA